MEDARSLHILILTDRDWTHPQGGGTGSNLYGQVARWLRWGHRVTVVSGAFPGSAPVESPVPGLELHHAGTRLSVFPRTIWKVLRRQVGRDADVVLEVVNGIAFFTPLWLRRPRVALVHHVHRSMYVAELGRRGAAAAWLLETLPLRLLYGGTPFLTISEAARGDLEDLGIARERIHVAYLGVEDRLESSAQRSAEPTLLYLGRLKQYKRIEHVLDVLEAIPGATLDIAGEGDYRPALEAEIARRGLGERVRMHGFVNEQAKADLYARSWVKLTASSAEGWCLTVMEAALHETPSAALRVGGLTESIIDGDTGVLADTPEELTEGVRRVIGDPALRERLGRRARGRAEMFTWEHTAKTNLDVLQQMATGERQPLRTVLRRSETAKAAGLAVAALGAQLFSVLFTFVFARLLGRVGYGSLAALISTFLILSVPGLALQVAAARETALGRLGHGPGLSAVIQRWTRELFLAFLVLAGASVLARHQIASVIGVSEAWAAAATVPTGCLWLLLCLQRGVLQGIRAYSTVALSIVLETIGRLIGGLVLVLAGAGVTGAYLGTPAGFLAVSLVLAVMLRRRLGPARAETGTRGLRELIGTAWLPVAGLTLLAVLQNVDVIMVKHQLSGRQAGAYAAAAVAAKLVVWVAIAVAGYLLPEAARAAAAGEDARPVLVRALGIIGVVAIPALLVFVALPHLLLQVAFGPKFTSAAGALPVLGAAMSLLACAYLAVQYMLALGRASFLWVLGLVAVAEPILLSAGGRSIAGCAALVFGLQCLAASVVLVLSFRTRVRVAA